MARTYPLIGGPLCGETLPYTKDEVRVRIRAGAGPLIALYRFAVNGYYHKGTKEATEFPPNPLAEYRLAELDSLETPGKWTGPPPPKVEGSPPGKWEGPPWTVWALKH